MSSKDYFSYCNLIVCCGISFAACGRSAEINCIVILSYAIQLLQNPYVTYIRVFYCAGRLILFE